MIICIQRTFKFIHFLKTRPLELITYVDTKELNFLNGLAFNIQTKKIALSNLNSIAINTVFVQIVIIIGFGNWFSGQSHHHLPFWSVRVFISFPFFPFSFLFPSSSSSFSTYFFTKAWQGNRYSFFSISIFPSSELWMLSI